MTPKYCFGFFTLHFGTHPLPSEIKILCILLNVHSIEFISFSMKSAPVTNICGRRKGSADAANTMLASLDVKELKQIIADDADPGVLRGIRRSDLCRLIKINTRLKKLAPPLRYNGMNSCFIDTAFVALFHRRSRWLEKHVYNASPAPQFSPAHRAIRAVIDKVRRVFLQSSTREKSMTCVSVRNQFRKPAFRDFNIANDFHWDGAQDEPLNIMKTLQFAYSLPEAVTLSNKQLSSGRRRRMQSVFYAWYIPVWDLEAGKAFDQVFPVLTNDDDGLDTRFVKAPLLYMQLQRVKPLYGHTTTETRKLQNPFVPRDSIDSGTGRRLQLVSIIIHQGDSTSGHYTAILKLKHGIWVHYDDLDSSVRLVGTSLKHAMAYRKGLAKRNAVGFVYM